jgi:hypothetical protein
MSIEIPSVAWHEAGHCVVASMLGRNVLAAYIKSTEPIDGGCEQAGNRPGTNLTIDQVVMMKLAGVVAEALASIGQTQTEVVDEANRLLRMPSAGADYMQAKSMIQNAETVAEEDKRIGELIEKTYVLLADAGAWSKVIEIATALTLSPVGQDACQRLGRNELSSILDST